LDAMRTVAQSCMDLVDVILVALDPDGRISQINRKGCQILGYTEDELIGENWFDLCLPPDERDSVSTVFKKMMDGMIEPFERYENKILCRDGQERSIAWHNAMLRDEAGRITQSLSAGEEITERRKVEEALALTEERYRTLAENTIDVIYQLDIGGNFRYVGPQVSRYGYQPADLISHHLSEFLHPDDEERVIGGLLDVVTAGGSFSDRYRIIDAHGQVIWVEATGQDLRDPVGRIVGSTGVLRDLTERMGIEEALRESEERFRRVFEEGPMGMTIAGPDFRFVMVNAAFSRVLGYSEQELTLLTFRDITHPDEIDRDAEAIQRLLAGEIQLYRTEKQYICKNKEVVWGALTLSAMRGNDGQFLYFLAMVEDITARKATEAAVHESEERYRHLVESSNDWVWEVDARGVYTCASPRIRDVLGYTPEEILGKEPFDLMSPDEAERVAQIFGPIIAEQRPFRGLVNTNRHKDGRLVVLETNGVPSFNEKGDFCGYRGMDRDITEQARAGWAQETMMEHQCRLAAIVEASDDAIFWTSADSVIQSWNAGAARMLGYAAEEAVGRSLAALIPAEKRKLLEDYLPGCGRGGPMDLFETEILHKNGRRVPVTVKVRRVNDGAELFLAFFIREVAGESCRVPQAREAREPEAIG
jgi:PAS domain S-box-containing protein